MQNMQLIIHFPKNDMSGIFVEVSDTVEANTIAIFERKKEFVVNNNNNNNNNNNKIILFLLCQQQG